jgi:acyl-CoA synthetase (AMP-forming)/AMP-acid ligase II
LRSRKELFDLADGSSPIRPATAARLLAEHPSIGLLQGYSQTEGGPITALTPDDHRGAARRPELLGSVGRAVRDPEVIIRRPDGDGIGEVWARGGHLAAPAPDGWLQTGDLGRLGTDGYLYLSGRKGDMIIRGGENVYPEEVENRIASHSGIQEAAVVGAPHEVLGEEVVAFIVPADPGGSPNCAVSCVRNWPGSRCPPGGMWWTNCPGGRSARSCGGRCGRRQ